MTTKLARVAVLGLGKVGSLVGASFNYVVSMWLGRPLLERWGRYFFVRPELLQKTDAFFSKNGAVSTSPVASYPASAT